MRAILILLLLFTHAPDPRLRAQWDTPTRARVSWHQTTRGCLYVEHATAEQAWVGCYEESGAVSVEPSGAAIGDIYILHTGGYIYRTRLVWTMYIPAL
jgi:hypothetical protein